MNALPDLLLGELYSQDEAKQRLTKDYILKAQFSAFGKEYQKILLEFEKGIKPLPMYLDGFFDYCIGNPSNMDTTSILLSDILGCKVTITEQLDDVINVTDKLNYYTVRYAIKFENESMADLVLMKMDFTPSEEMLECIQANNTISQYNRLKQIKGSHFRFDLLRPCYTVIFTEKSLQNVKKQDKINDFCVWHDNKTFSQGAPSLSHLIMLSYEDYLRSKGKKNSNLDAWMTFLTSNDPSDALQLATIFPHFAEIYKRASLLRNDTPNLINLMANSIRHREHNDLVFAHTAAVFEVNGLIAHNKELQTDLYYSRKKASKK